MYMYMCMYVTFSAVCLLHVAGTSNGPCSIALDTSEAVWYCSASSLSGDRMGLGSNRSGWLHTYMYTCTCTYEHMNHASIIIYSVSQLEASCLNDSSYRGMDGPGLMITAGHRTKSSQN